MDEHGFAEPEWAADSLCGGSLSGDGVSGHDVSGDGVSGDDVAGGEVDGVGGVGWDDPVDSDDGLAEALVAVGCLESAVRLGLVRLVARLGRRGVWRAEGQTCMANWVALQCGVALGTARLGQSRQVVDDLGDPGDLARKLVLRPDAGGGLGRISGLLPVDELEAVRVALDRIREQEGLGAVDPDSGRRATGVQQRADALVCLARRWLGADADVERSTVVLHADVGLLTGEGLSGHASLADGTPLAAETLRRCCDTRVEWGIEGGGGVVLGVGRAARVWPAWLARLIRGRDGERCHAVHEGGWSVAGTGDAEVVFWGPTGTRLVSRPRRLDRAVKRRLGGCAPHLWPTDPDPTDTR